MLTYSELCAHGELQLPLCSCSHLCDQFDTVFTSVIAVNICYQVVQPNEKQLTVLRPQKKDPRTISSSPSSCYASPLLCSCLSVPCTLNLVVIIFTRERLFGVYVGQGGLDGEKSKQEGGREGGREPCGVPSVLLSGLLFMSSV